MRVFFRVTYRCGHTAMRSRRASDPGQERRAQAAVADRLCRACYQANLEQRRKEREARPHWTEGYW
jgi:vacuolar-type H+-ATPase subunit E/Vma4